MYRIVPRKPVARPCNPAFFFAAILFSTHIACAQEIKEINPADKFWGKVKELVVGGDFSFEAVTKQIRATSEEIDESIKKPHTASAVIPESVDDIHVGVGDVYALPVKFSFKREIRPYYGNLKFLLWTYGYDVYVDETLAYSRTLAIRQPDFTADAYWGEEYSLTKSIYLLAASLGNPDCKGDGSATIAIRAWIKADWAESKEKNADTGTAIWAESVAANKIGGMGAGAGQRKIIIHNPWSVSLDETPGDVIHADKDADGTIKFKLNERRPFPKYNPGNPPRTATLDTTFDSTSPGHFDLTQTRKPPPGLLAVSDKGNIDFTQPYKFHGKKGHHDPLGDLNVEFTFDAKLSGKRKLVGEAKQEFEWQAAPTVVTPGGEVCGKHTWRIVDKDSDTIDQCLVGTWDAKEVAQWKGFSVTFKSDGTQTIDYSKAEPLKAGNDLIHWRGIGTNVITTANKQAKIKETREGTVTMELKLPNTPPFIWKLGRLTGLAGLGGTTGDNKYECTDTALTYQGSTHRDRHPNYAVILTRRR